MTVGTRSRSAIRIDALQRLLMWNFLSSRLKLYLVTEFPKSGGSWLGQMLSSYLEVPFPRNQRAHFESCIMHGHYLYSPRFQNVICVMRDGRDIMVSAYYHWLFPNERNNPEGVERHRERLPFENYEDIEANLPRFIDYMFTVYPRGRFHFSWAEFVNSWVGQEAIIVKYEDLVEDTPAAMSRVLWELSGAGPDEVKVNEVVAQYSFKRQAGRRAGQENARSFLRKGVAGDWRNKFSREARQIFDHYGGEALIHATYESDHSWVQ